MATFSSAYTASGASKAGERLLIATLFARHDLDVYTVGLLQSNQGCRCPFCLPADLKTTIQAHAEGSRSSRLCCRAHRIRADP